MFGITDYLYRFFKSRKRDRLIGNGEFNRHVINHEKGNPLVCFLPWRMTFSESMKQDLVPKNRQAIIYEGPTSLVGTNPLQSRESLERIVDNLNDYLEKEGIQKKKLTIIGVSLGTFPAFYIANNLGVKRLIAVCPGARLGENIYGSIATRKIKKEAQEKYPSHEDYDRLLGGFNPIDNISNLPKNEIYVEAGNFDRYIPSRSGRELINALRENRKNPHVKFHDFFGHCLTIHSWAVRNRKKLLSYLD